MIEAIAEIINNHTYTVDQWLLDTLDEEAKKPAYSSRENVDALALEFTARRVGKMKVDKIATNPETGEEENYQWRHDWKYDKNTFIDLKRKPTKWPNICLNDIPKMIQSYERKQLTHIVGYTQNIEHDYKIGQVLEFEFKGILPLREAVNLSERKGDTWRVLNVNHLQNTKLKV
jgi:hypothetical protein